MVIEQEKQQLDKQIVLKEQNRKHYLLFQNKWLEKLKHAKASFATAQAKFTSGKIEAILYSSVKNQTLLAEYDVLKNGLQLQYIDLKINLLKYNSF